MIYRLASYTPISKYSNRTVTFCIPVVEMFEDLLYIYAKSFSMSFSYGPCEYIMHHCVSAWIHMNILHFIINDGHMQQEQQVLATQFHAITRIFYSLKAEGRTVGPTTCLTYIWCSKV